MDSKDEIGNSIKLLVLPVIISMILTIASNSEGKLKNSEYVDVTANLTYETFDEQQVKKENNNIEIASNNYNIMERLTGITNAYSISFNGSQIGYIAREQRVSDILIEVVNIHIEKLGLPKKDIISTDIFCDIDSKEVKVAISEISNSRNLAQDIYNSMNSGGESSVIDVKVQKKITENIEPEVVTKKDETLYIGENIEESGTIGLKEKLVEITYSNEDIDSINTISEATIKEPIDTIIREGVKNPFEYGIAFLNSPTNGGQLTSNYGPRWGAFHKGIDVAGNIGDDVFAAIDGEVVYAQYNDGGYGNLIMLEHYGGMTTYYAHLDSLYVTVGDIVTKGDVIGAIGNTGFSTGPHLHFELRVDDSHVDPIKYIMK